MGLRISISLQILNPLAKILDDLSQSLQVQKSSFNPLVDLGLVQYVSEWHVIMDALLLGDLVNEQNAP